MTFDVCKFCWSDLRGPKIPEDQLKAGYFGEWDGIEERWFSRLIGIELSYDDANHYDGVSQWQCPDCGARWDRWSGERLTDA